MYKCKHNVVPNLLGIIVGVGSWLLFTIIKSVENKSIVT